MTTPDLVVGELLAYRAWHVLDGARLVAWASAIHWPSASMTASCVSRLAGLSADTEPHVSPVTGCTCGLYAYYRPSSVSIGETLVFGAVAVHGRVILAARGLKAQHMSIRGLVADTDEKRAAARRYGVPAYPTREDLLADYPPQDYRGLIDVDTSEPPDLPLPAAFQAMAASLNNLQTALARLAEQIAATGDRPGRRRR